MGNINVIDLDRRYRLNRRYGITKGVVYDFYDYKNNVVTQKVNQLFGSEFSKNPRYVVHLMKPDCVGPHERRTQILGFFDEQDITLLMMSL